MPTNSQIFTGLALPISPSASLQQASPSSFNSVCIAKKSITTPFLNPVSGLGTLKIKKARVAASCQSRGGRHRRLLVRANLFDRFTRGVKSFSNAVASFLEDPEKFTEQLAIDLEEKNDDIIEIHQLLEGVLASQQKFESEYKVAEAISEQWYRKARFFLEKGEEDLAREALKMWISYGEDAIIMKFKFDSERNLGYILLYLAKPLAGKMQQAVAKERAKAWRTATKVSGASGNVNTSSTLSALEQLQEKASAWKSEAALGQLTTEELNKKFNVMRIPADDDRVIEVFKKELAATKKEVDEPPRWASPLYNFVFNGELKALRRQIEEENKLGRKAKEL